MSGTSSMAQRGRNSFTARTRARGEGYQQAGRVCVLGAPQRFGEAHAEVLGSAYQRYDVSLTWDETARAVVAYCSCPVGEREELCKHVYAMLLELDEQGRRIEPFVAAGELRVIPFIDVPPAGVSWELIDAPTPAVRQPGWQQMLEVVSAAPQPRGYLRRSAQLEYYFDDSAGKAHVTLRWRNVLKSGALGKCRMAQVNRFEVQELSGTDAAIFALVEGCDDGSDRYMPYGGYGGYGSISRFAIDSLLAERMLPLLCSTGRFGLAVGGHERDTEVQLRPLQWDPTAYALTLRLSPGNPPSRVVVSAELRGGGDVIALSELRCATEDGIIVIDDRIARVEPLSGQRRQPWLRPLFVQGGSIEVPASQVTKFMAGLASNASLLPALEVDEALPWEVRRAEAKPRLRFLRAHGSAKKVAAQLWFGYPLGGGVEWLRYEPRAAAICHKKERQLLLRDGEQEAAALDELLSMGLARCSQSISYDHYDVGGADLSLDANAFVATVCQLLDAGWDLEAEGGPLRSMPFPQIKVASGIDWFEVALGPADETALELPELLRALRAGEPFVTLSDGSRGVLPAEWLARFAPLAALGSRAGSALRFSRGSGVLLDAMLATHPRAEFDADYSGFRKELSRFERLRPAKSSRRFVGELRPYQALGLAWLKLLSRVGLGGCLADDMGLGKTVQVLALLASAPKSKRRGPTLVVAPRSLVFNWLDEAARFVPSLRTASYLGPKRKQLDFDALDLVVTTYGTLRRDVERLAARPFHYLVLDEASAIKNSASQIAKACRLLDAEHRLALTGTPVENRLTDLASILEFLNPGMIGATRALESLVLPFAAKEQTQQLGRALRPVLLRRTKQEVLTDLPDKTEQVLLCELPPKQRKSYDALREHYRALLDKTIEKQGLARSKIQVLEALLRLRQAACHPGLLDESRCQDSSAKLEALLASLDEVVESGHKALVFSQFTSMLAIVRNRLDGRGVSYAYLDGSTRKRKQQVERFQNDAACPVFLISLKAGGHGLNLTAAEYVFLLDPWWNPAVEAQAVDRAHRIGQQRAVFAYRVIASDTVEERVLELQEQKRELAEDLFAGHGGGLRDLTADDLGRLLS